MHNGIYANWATVTFADVTATFLMAVLSDAFIMTMSPVFISVLTSLKNPAALTVAIVSAAT